MIEKLLRLPYAPLSFSICYQHNKFLLNLWLKHKNYFMLFIEGQGIPGCEYPYDDPSVVVHSSDSHLSPCGCWSSRWVHSSGRARKTREFKLILWASSSLIFFAQGHFLPFLVSDNAREWLARTFTDWANNFSKLLALQEYLPIPGDYRIGLFSSPESCYFQYVFFSFINSIARSNMASEFL